MRKYTVNALENLLKNSPVKPSDRDMVFNWGKDKIESGEFRNEVRAFNECMARFPYSFRNFKAKKLEKDTTEEEKSSTVETVEPVEEPSVVEPETEVEVEPEVDPTPETEPETAPEPEPEPAKKKPRTRRTKKTD